MTDVIGKIIMLIALIVTMFLAPITYNSVIETAREHDYIQKTAIEFLDKVADTKEIKQIDLDKLALDLNATTLPIEFEVYREKKVINPIPNGNGQTYSSFVRVSDNTKYDVTDYIILDIKQIRPSNMQSIAKAFSRLYIRNFNEQYVKKVR